MRIEVRDSSSYDVVDSIRAMATPSISGQDDQEMQGSTQEMATSISQAYSAYPVVNVDEQVSCNRSIRVRSNH